MKKFIFIASFLMVSVVSFSQVKTLKVEGDTFKIKAVSGYYLDQDKKTTEIIYEGDIIPIICCFDSNPFVVEKIYTGENHFEFFVYGKYREMGANLKWFDKYIFLHFKKQNGKWVRVK